jgi:hypothetical protein
MPTTIIPATWQIPDTIRNRLGSQVGRQRAMFHEGHLLLVLHAPPKSQDAQRQGRFFWRNPQGEWASKDLGVGIRALARHIEEYEEIIARLDREEEHATTADKYFQVLESLAPVYRAARNMHHVLQEARKLCPADPDIINMRDRAYVIERNAELLYGETKNALDFAVVKRAEEQAQSTRHMAIASHRLNMLVAFFFPIATLTAVFGVNLEHGFEHEHAPYLFLGTIAVGLVLGLMLTAFVGRCHRDKD